MTFHLVPFGSDPVVTLGSALAGVVIAGLAILVTKWIERDGI